MDGMVTTPLTSEEAEKTLAQLEENKQTRLNRMKRDLKVNILFQCFHTFFQAFSISYIKFFSKSFIFRLRRASGCRRELTASRCIYFLAFF